MKKEYDFDEIIERRGSGSVKWDLLGPVFGNPDLIPLWIADTDFRMPYEVEAAIKKRLECPVLGYSTQPRNFTESLAGWLESRHGARPDEKWICCAQGLVRALAEALNALTDEGDRILLTTPVYDPFYSVVELNKRIVQRNPLVLKGSGDWRLDLNSMEDSFREGTKAVLLCNPQNPTGRVWRRDELAEIASLCVKYRVLMFSDDIHCDIHRTGCRYTPAFSVSDDIKELLVEFHAPGKSFNIAGLKGAVAIIPEETLRKRFTAYQERFHGGKMNTLAFEAFAAAYSTGGAYVDQLNFYLEQNAIFLADYINSNIPGLTTYVPEGTFLTLCDCSSLGLESWDLVKHLSEASGILFSRGAAYGDETKAFIRINFGCRRDLLKKACIQLKEGVAKIKKS